MDKNKALKDARANYKAAMVSSGAAFMIVLVLIDPDTYLLSALNGLELFGTKVAPALFPFFFFSGLITRLGGAERAGALFRRPASLFYNVPGCGGYVWCMSVLSGYPVGAKLTRELYEGGAIDRAQARAIASFTSTSGPLFVVGTVAAGMFENAKAGYILLAVHFTAALINGFFYRGKKQSFVGAAVKPKKSRPLEAVSESMSSALSSLLTVGGYIVVFGMAADALVNVGLIPLLARLFEPLVSREVAEGVLIGLIEVTKGADRIAKAGVDAYSALPALSFILSFGGLSIIGQSLSFLSPCGIGAGKFLPMKLTQSLAALLLSLILAIAIKAFS